MNKLHQSLDTQEILIRITLYVKNRLKFLMGEEKQRLLCYFIHYTLRV